MNPRLLPNLVAVVAIACLVVATFGLAGIFIALLVLGVLLVAVACLLSLQTPAERDAGPDAVEKALAAAQERHDLELESVVSQAEERGREEIRRQYEAQRRADQEVEALRAELK